jgi:hypothetical protein
MRPRRSAVLAALLSGTVFCSRFHRGAPEAENLDSGGRDIAGCAEDIAPATSEDAAGFSVSETGKPEAETDAPRQSDSPVVPDGSISSVDADTDAATVPRAALRKFVGNTLNLEVRSDFVKYWDQLSIGPTGQLGAVRSSSSPSHVDFFTKHGWNSDRWY